jgi:PQQ-dependent dehydrogenase (methanol/ethanol family)
MRRRFAVSVGCVLLLALVGFAAGQDSKIVDDARLKDADRDAANWVMYGRTYDDHRFSPLSQINEQSVARLGLVWSRELGTTRGLEATPLVEDGVIYTTGSWSVVYAIDAKTGAVRWTYDPAVARDRVAFFVCCDVVNRGVALYRGKVYVGTLDGRLIALDARSGTPVWTAQTVEANKPYAITGYPRIARGMVIIGNAGAEYGVRGYISAYDAETGKMAWRTYTVPGDPSHGFESKALERAAKTWNGDWWTAGGGGTVWEGIVYDPALDLLYFGTGNATAWYRGLRGNGEGDNLYTASILAVHAQTGELAWHFQTAPKDNWDFDATQPLLQADLTIAGRARKVIMQASKNGFFYVLDRKTGEFISGAPFVSGITWASGLDRKSGRPVETPAAYAGLDPIIVSPDPGGAHNWNPMAFNPTTGFVYLPAKVGTQGLHVPDAKWKYNARVPNLGGDPFYEGPMTAKLRSLPPPTGELLAWDPVKQRAAWHAPYPVVEGGGVLTTGGNLVFQGRADGVLAAYRATDGQRLWEFDAGTGIMAPPVTYLVDGQQYVSVMAGWGGADALGNAPNRGKVKPGYGRILTFALGATGKLTVPAFGHTGPPTPAITMNASPQTIQGGKLLYGAMCGYCHGADAVAGPLPDLRYASKAVHAQFEAIVLGGARASLGMPSFKDLLTPDQLRAIQAYILSRAAEGAGAPPK